MHKKLPWSIIEQNSIGMEDKAYAISTNPNTNVYIDYANMISKSIGDFFSLYGESVDALSDRSYLHIKYLTMLNNMLKLKVKEILEVCCNGHKSCFIFTRVPNKETKLKIKKDYIPNINISYNDVVTLMSENKNTLNMHSRNTLMDPKDFEYKLYNIIIKKSMDDPFIDKNTGKVYRYSRRYYSKYITISEAVNESIMVLLNAINSNEVYKNSCKVFYSYLEDDIMLSMHLRERYEKKLADKFIIYSDDSDMLALNSDIPNCVLQKGESAVITKDFWINLFNQEFSRTSILTIWSFLGSDYTFNFMSLCNFYKLELDYYSNISYISKLKSYIFKNKDYESMKKIQLSDKDIQNKLRFFVNQYDFRYKNKLYYKFLLFGIKVLINEYEIEFKELTKEEYNKTFKSIAEKKEEIIKEKLWKIDELYGEDFYEEPDSDSEFKKETLKTTIGEINPINIIKSKK